MRALLIDTNIAALPIYNYLLELKFIVFLGGKNPNDVLARASENFIEFDYSNVSEIIRIVKEYEVDIVIPGCNDISYLSAAKFYEIHKTKYPINISTVSQTELFRNKDKFKIVCEKLNVSVPKYFTKQELSKINSDISIIIKPVDSFSGKGISVLKTIDKTHLELGIKNAISESVSGKYIIEEFCDGKLHSHSAIIKNGKITRDFLVEEYCNTNRFAVDESWLVLNPILLQLIRAEVYKLINGLKLQNGLLHTQFIYNGNKLWLIESTRRCPGDLYSLLIEFSTGYKYGQEYVDGFIGQLALSVRDNISSELAKTKKIIRRTIKSITNIPWYSLDLPSSEEKFLKFFPLNYSGYRNTHEDYRVGILFTERI